MTKNYAFIISQITNGTSFRFANDGTDYSDIKKFDDMPTKEECDTWWSDNQAQVEEQQVEEQATYNLKKDFLNENAEDFIRLIIRALKEVNESDSTIFSTDTKQQALALINKFKGYKQL